MSFLCLVPLQQRLPSEALIAGADESSLWPHYVCMQQTEPTFSMPIVGCIVLHPCFKESLVLKRKNSHSVGQNAVSTVSRCTSPLLVVQDSASRAVYTARDYKNGLCSLSRNLIGPYCGVGVRALFVLTGSRS
ncbi:2,3-bisphosphoglycerate-independent phosphoglycerate mutase [Clarias magur]|uniref:2,3-bisphosphoglycerate-independent phosphoglycerate mutase n=1 Tax=Clarias magur TaxID=1594786 RepID=A0A8J4UB46_CLAMG|nr:2,3-bisphosphoglycerate-independent phosphoglycerate mutase [Clarias magur]